MQKKTLRLILFSILLVLFSANSVFSSIEVFSSYDTILEVKDDNSIIVTKHLTLKNVYDVGIVPGQIEFKVARGTGDGSVANLNVFNVSATDRFGKEIKTQVRNTIKYSVIVLDVYYPLLPGFEYEFDLRYELSYKPGGIFFKSLHIPIRESTIPIEVGTFKVVLPNNYYFTHLDLDSENLGDVVVESNVAIWDIKNDMPKSISFEYSWIPIQIGGMKGSYVFWVFVNLVLLGVLFFEVRREIGKVRNAQNEKS